MFDHGRSASSSHTHAIPVHTSQRLGRSVCWYAGRPATGPGRARRYSPSHAAASSPGTVPERRSAGGPAASHARIARARAATWTGRAAGAGPTNAAAAERAKSSIANCGFRDRRLHYDCMRSFATWAARHWIVILIAAPPAPFQSIAREHRRPAGDRRDEPRGEPTLRTAPHLIVIAVPKQRSARRRRRSATARSLPAALPSPRAISDGRRRRRRCRRRRHLGADLGAWQFGARRRAIARSALADELAKVRVDLRNNDSCRNAIKSTTATAPTATTTTCWPCRSSRSTTAGAIGRRLRVKNAYEKPASPARPVRPTRCTSARHTTRTAVTTPSRRSLSRS